MTRDHIGSISEVVPDKIKHRHASSIGLLKLLARVKQRNTDANVLSAIQSAGFSIHYRITWLDDSYISRISVDQIVNDSNYLNRPK